MRYRCLQFCLCRVCKLRSRPTCRHDTGILSFSALGRAFIPSNMAGVVAMLWSQYKLLMWKNLVLLKRSPFRIFVEIFWPLTLFIILVAVRSRDTLLQHNDQCHFHNKPMPSAGLLPFLQVCKLDDMGKRVRSILLYRCSGCCCRFQF